MSELRIIFDIAIVQMGCPDPCDGHFETLEKAIALVCGRLKKSPKVAISFHQPNSLRPQRKIAFRIFLKSTLQNSSIWPYNIIKMVGIRNHQKEDSEGARNHEDAIQATVFHLVG